MIGDSGWLLLVAGLARFYKVHRSNYSRKSNSNLDLAVVLGYHEGGLLEE